MPKELTMREEDGMEEPLDTGTRHQLDSGDLSLPRKPYATPRLTKHGSIVTQTTDPSFDAVPSGFPI